jgi:flagellar motility protein MotE (MotC chaperone)
MPRLRLLALVPPAIGLLLLARLDAWTRGDAAPEPVIISSALAQSPAAPVAPSPASPAPAPAEAAERAVLEALRSRRAEIEAREAALTAREQVLAAAEQRLGQRIEELTALQGRLEALERERAAREEAGVRGLVKLYEGMRPREAASDLRGAEAARAAHDPRPDAGGKGRPRAWRHAAGAGAAGHGGAGADAGRAAAMRGHGAGGAAVLRDLGRGS